MPTNQPQMIEPDSYQTHLLSSLRHRLSNLWLKLRGLVQFSVGVLAALLALTIYNSLNPAAEPLTERELRETIFQAMASATPAPAYSTQVYQMIRPSLVLIQTQAEGEDGERDNGLGSGVVINANGDVLTSLHVVEGKSDIQIVYADGTHAQGVIIASVPEKDIAVLGSDLLPEILVPAVLGNPHAMRVGDEAFAVGNPFGLYSSVSAGVISGFGRTFQPEGRDFWLEDLIQVDAAVNPGNSGGPLLNRQGHVVGIVVGIINPTEADFFIGIGFAVPIDVAASAAGAPQH
jgi:S1-C subfamily serine protease